MMNNYDEPQRCHGCCVKRYYFMFVRFQVHIHSLCQLILDIRRFRCVPPTCLSFGLLASPVGLSVSQTSMDDSAHKVNTGQLFNSRVLIYDSSLSLSVSVKVITKSFDACLNSTQCYCFRLMCQAVINQIASKQCVRE